MKKIFAFLLILTMCISLFACKKEEANVRNMDSTTAAIEEPAIIDYTLSNARYLCQFVKDCLAEPDSFQIHGVSHIEENEHHYYYLDFSHMVKNSEMERTYYYGEFEEASLLCIVNEHSAIYYQADEDYTAKYPELSALFRETSSQALIVDSILSELE